MSDDQSPSAASTADGAASQNTLENFLRFLQSVPGVLETVFNFVKEVCAAILSKIDKLRTQNVQLRGKYRRYCNKLEKLRKRVISYIRVMQNHPTINERMKQAIFQELNDDSNGARLDTDNVEIFPHIIDFLSRLETWLKKAKAEYDELKEKFDKFDQKIRKVLKEAEDMHSQASHWKVLAIGAIGTSGIAIATGTGMLLHGGQVHSGVLLMSLGSIATMWSFLMLGSFQNLEKSSKEIKFLYDKIHEDSHNFRSTALEVNIEGNISILTSKMETLQCQHLLISLEEPFIKIFEIFEHYHFGTDLEKVENASIPNEDEGDC